MSKWRRMPSAISAAMPWPFGGISCRRWPQVSMPIGSTHSGLKRGEVVDASSRRRWRAHAPRPPPRSRRRRAPRLASAAIAFSARAAAGKAKRSPTSGGRPCGRNASAQPGKLSSSGAAATHFCWTIDGHRVAALGDLDRRREQVGERQLAEALGQRDPAGDRAGHRHRVPAAHRRPARRRRRTCGGSTPASRPPAPGPRR